VQVAPARAFDSAGVSTDHCGPEIHHRPPMNQPQPPAAERIPSGIPGLDDVLHGGFVRGSVVIVQGAPGAGKTVLANQFAFGAAARGGKVLYLTLLSESHGRLLTHLASMAFFDPAIVSAHVRYVSGFDTLEREGIKGVLRLLATEARSLGAEAIVLDGLFVLEENAESTREFRKFINAVSLQAEVMNCTMLLLTNSHRADSSPEYTMVDGWIELSRTLHEYRASRSLQVHKQRGSGFRSGLHTLAIDERGITVLPRLETEPLAPVELDATHATRVSSGNPRLDRLVDGGVREGSTTLVMGPAGVGKTSLGLQFLTAATAEAPALLFGFYETPDRIMAKAAALELDFEGAVARGALQVLWNPPTEASIDNLGHQLVDAVERQGTRRLLVDGIDGFRQAALHPRRISRFMTALCNALRARGCTALFTMETSHLFGESAHFRIESMSAIAENVLLMRYRESDGALHRTLGVIKVRDSGFDPAVREFEIGRGGLHIGNALHLRPGDP
jgi:circadian clock protein KaiC